MVTERQEMDVAIYTNNFPMCQSSQEQLPEAGIEFHFFKLVYDLKGYIYSRY